MYSVCIYLAYIYNGTYVYKNNENIWNFPHVSKHENISSTLLC